MQCESLERVGRLAVPLVVLCMWGCQPSASEREKTAAGGDAVAVSPSPSDAQSALAPGWPAGDDAAQSLSELAEAVRAKFGDYVELEELIYPDGWVRRELAVGDVRQEVTETQLTPKGEVIVSYQRQSTLIHPTREAAAEDAELFPYASLQSKDQIDSPLRRPNPKVELRIEYELRDTGEGRRWVRRGWSSEPAVAEGHDFLDRIGVP